MLVMTCVLLLVLVRTTVLLEGLILVTGHSAGCSNAPSTRPSKLLLSHPLSTARHASIFMSPHHVFIMAFIKHLLTTNQHCYDQLVP